MSSGEAGGVLYDRKGFSFPGFARADSIGNCRVVQGFRGVGGVGLLGRSGAVRIHVISGL